MNTITIPLEVPSDILVALNETEDSLKNEFQTNTAILLYQRGKLTLGKAIQLSGVGRYEFEKKLAVSKVSVSNLTIGQIFDDVEKLNDE